MEGIQHWLREANPWLGGVNKSHPSTFTVVTKRQTPSSIEGLQDDAANEVEAKSTSLFTCSEEGCAKTFFRHSSLLRHLDCGKHQLVLERETLFDKAALEYQHQLEGHGGDTLEPILSALISSTGTQYLTMGWVLKVGASRRTRSTATQRSYLTDKFRRGEEKESRSRIGCASNDHRQGCARFQFQALHQWGFPDRKSSGGFFLTPRVQKSPGRGS